MPPWQVQVLAQVPPLDPARGREWIPNYNQIVAALNGLTLAGLLFAAVLFGAFAWLLYDTFYAPSPDTLYAEYFEPYPNLFATTPPTTEDERDLQRTRVAHLFQEKHRCVDRGMRQRQHEYVAVHPTPHKGEEHGERNNEPDEGERDLRAG